MSSFSVDIGVLEVWELREIELFEGDKAPEGRRSGLFGTGGARFLPLPSTRPPPRLLRAAIISRLLDRAHAAEEFGGGISESKVIRRKLAGCFQVDGVKGGGIAASSIDLRLSFRPARHVPAPMTRPFTCRIPAAHGQKMAFLRNNAIGL